MSRLALTVALLTTLSSSVAVAGSPSFARPPELPEPPTAAPLDARPEAPPAPIPTVSRAEVRAKLLAARRANLARFRAYQKKGVFPSNVYTSSALNVWLDVDGNYCAAATIIRMSGQVALVEQVAADDNFIRLADVTSGPLMDWILTSGLTQAELVAIQRPFRPVTQRPQLVPEPETAAPIVVDARMRLKETARLRALYKQIEANIVRNERKSLEAAVDRLMKQPALAYAFVNG